ncbi:MAG TPA: peptidylprolyl isomerase, partial [Prolixibacteraceae bacterium]|nr:peptidylprolyl isomerase [Prolixibacteraceae bacterium]
MKKLTVTALVWLGILFSSAAQQKDKVLVTIGGQPVGLEEFIRIYRKNNENLQNPEDKKSPQAYLDLFVNFKLKVREAEQLGLDTTQAFRNELAGYRRELAAPYLTDIQLNEQLVQETYRRMTREVNASHILVALPENPSPADTLAAYQRAAEIRRQVLSGVDFNQAAEKWSQDPSAKNNRGNLGWFTVFQMVYPFEEAAYTTPVGEVSLPVRSAFGYHLVKVNGVREARGEIKVAHLMKAFPQNATPAQKAAAHRSADSIYALLQNGANFAELARTLSDDQRSAASGGEMPWFSAAVMIPQFAE